MKRFGNAGHPAEEDSDDPDQLEDNNLHEAEERKEALAIQLKNNKYQAQLLDRRAPPAKLGRSPE